MVAAHLHRNEEDDEQPQDSTNEPQNYSSRFHLCRGLTARAVGRAAAESCAQSGLKVGVSFPSFVRRGLEALFRQVAFVIWKVRRRPRSFRSWWRIVPGIGHGKCQEQ